MPKEVSINGSFKRVPFEGDNKALGFGVLGSMYPNRVHFEWP